MHDAGRSAVPHYAQSCPLIWITRGCSSRPQMRDRRGNQSVAHLQAHFNPAEPRWASAPPLPLPPQIASLGSFFSPPRRKHKRLGALALVFVFSLGRERRPDVWIGALNLKLRQSLCCLSLSLSLSLSLLVAPHSLLSIRSLLCDRRTIRAIKAVL